MRYNGALPVMQYSRKPACQLLAQGFRFSASDSPATFGCAHTLKRLAPGDPFSLSAA
jgi:hypothetical protein